MQIYIGQAPKMGREKYGRAVRYGVLEQCQTAWHTQGDSKVQQRENLCEDRKEKEEKEEMKTLVDAYNMPSQADLYDIASLLKEYARLIEELEEKLDEAYETIEELKLTYGRG
jgi:hypothetical protein